MNILYPSQARSTLVIIDDNPTVWEGVRAHLVDVKPYYYFDESVQVYKDYNDKQDSDTYLQDTLTPLLKTVHDEFFQLKAKKTFVSVENILRPKRKKILSGVIIYQGLKRVDNNHMRLVSYVTEMGLHTDRDLIRLSSTLSHLPNN